MYKRLISLAAIGVLAFAGVPRAAVYNLNISFSGDFRLSGTLETGITPDMATLQDETLNAVITRPSGPTVAFYGPETYFAAINAQSGSQAFLPEGASNDSVYLQFDHLSSFPLISTARFIDGNLPGDEGHYTFVASDGNVEQTLTSAAAEPSTWVLMIAAIGTTGLVLRRARRKVEPDQRSYLRPWFRYDRAVNS